MDKAALALIGQAEICVFIVQSFLLRPCCDSYSGQVLAHAQTCPGAAIWLRAATASLSLLSSVSIPASSTINKPSEYMILNIPPFCDHRVFFRNSARFS
jgi:hypothetical protein